ncbi:helix-turn-helix transcriptional regulator [Halogranum rubrum]|uniref:Uncharacterized protein n=1 Tax=Halogranum salarium B-1 TaxID=1210908 RepID=J3JF04_9EURY|nr:helix-turn-helix domain-containing protein [Halogranum salarium]EJN58834.1 hypothetical protein HSB1_22550 [Halogranum salarium B-1]
MEFPGVAVAVLVVGLVVAPTAVAGVVDDRHHAIDGVGAAQESFDRNEVRLTVYENRSARWTFHYERTLSNESERQDFDAFAEEFNSNETQLYLGFRRDSSALVAEGANITGREMEATGFARRADVTSSLGNDIGIVEMSFTWTSFGVENAGRTVVGDVFEGGLYLGPQQSLVVSPGPELRFESVEPPGTQSNSSSLPASDSVTWQGEQEFTDNRPQVVFVASQTGDGESSGVGGTEIDGNTGSVEAATTPSFWAGDSLPMLVGVVGVLVLGGAATVWYLRREEFGPYAESGDEAEQESEPVGTAITEPAVSDEELLTDEDRVVRMLETNGGRMKQVNIVSETGWSKSKVSMLLTDMEEEGLISKLRVGRENVISLKGHEPEAAGSPFDDE